MPCFGRLEMELQAYSFMYIVVRRYQIREGVDLEKTKDEIREKVRRDFLPHVQNLKGFVDYTLAFLDQGAVLSVSLFNIEASVGESVRAASQWIAKNLPDLFKDNPDIYYGEIALHEAEKDRKSA
jgi:hypothetical protein